MAHYADTSALVKLILPEPETDALRAWLAETQRVVVSCDLARTELTRAVRRGAPDRQVQTRAVLDALSLRSLDSAVFEAAGRLDPAPLRSLDAVHLAAALTFGDDLEGLLTYDERLAEAATRHGVTVVAPR